MAPARVRIELPVTSEEIHGIDSFISVVRKLAGCITGAVNENKSVTGPNKRLICEAAEEIRKATKVFETTLAVTSANVPAPPSTTEGLKKEIIDCVREELKKFSKQQQQQQQQQPRTQQTSQGRPSYAQVTATDGRPHALVDRCAELPATKPALLITPKHAKSKQDAIEAWRRSISFRNSGFAPARVQTVSNNKLRVEFNSREERDDTLNRLNGAEHVHAEPARMILPMVIIKGVSKDVPSEELVDIVIRQNTELSGLVVGDEDIRLRFLRKNRNPSLYNAVLVAQPRLWRKMLQMERLCVDHQRVHVDEFSPFVQCYSCLSFGHIQSNCPSEVKHCAHCAESSHLAADCPNKANPVSKCINCLKHNEKFNTNESTSHKATSTNCPRLRSMIKKINNRVDYGSN